MTNRLDASRPLRPASPSAASHARMPAVPARTRVASPRSPLPVPRTPPMGPASGGEFSSPSTLSLPSPERVGGARLGSPIPLAVALDDALRSPWNEDVRGTERPRGRRRYRRPEVHLSPAVLAAQSRAEGAALRAVVDGWLDAYATHWPTRQTALDFVSRLGKTSAKLLELQAALSRPGGRLQAVTASDAVSRVAAEEMLAVAPVTSNTAKLTRAQLAHVTQPVGLGLFDVPGLPLAAALPTYGALDGGDRALHHALLALQESLAALVAEGTIEAAPQAGTLDRAQLDVDAACKALVAYLEAHRG